MSSFWSVYVIVLVVINIIGCGWLLWNNAKRRPGDPAPNETSHIWDEDITEYNKPMPKWWMNLFWLTILFGIGYLIYYPGMGNFKGLGEWTSAKEVQQDKIKYDAKIDELFAEFAGKPIDLLAKNEKAVAVGERIFGNNCATCHGSTAKGAIGYPNLSDDIWHWGGSADQILATILNGRQGVMPPWGNVLRGQGGDQAVDAVTEYVQALAHPEAPISDLGRQGKKLYDGVCVACHGTEGKGNMALGAPNLTDSYWMYGSSKEAIAEGIEHGHHGVMPAHKDLIGDTRARLVGAYVWSLSHGDQAAHDGH